MARKVRSGFETRTARLKRPIAKKPEFVKIGLGARLAVAGNAAVPYLPEILGNQA